MSSAELEGLNLPELIARLADVAVPEPVAYTPETAGWWVLGALLVVGLTVTAIIAARRRQRNRYRRLALLELSEIEALPSGTSSVNVLHQVAELVRRTALTVYPRAEVAHLYGDEWRDFLNRSASRDLGSGVDGIVTGPYRRENAERDIPASIAAARNWIRSHHA